MKPSIGSDGGFFVPVTFFMRLRRDPISPMRNGGKNARGKSFFPLDPFLWWYESCFLYRQAGHGAPPAGARGRWTKTIAAACPAGGHAVTHSGQLAAGKAVSQSNLTGLHRPPTGPGQSPGALSPSFLQRKLGPAGGATCVAVSRNVKSPRCTAAGALSYVFICRG